MSDEKMLAKLETLDSSTFRPEFQQVCYSPIPSCMSMTPKHRDMIILSAEPSTTLANGTWVLQKCRLLLLKPSSVCTFLKGPSGELSVQILLPWSLGPQALLRTQHSHVVMLHMLHAEPQDSLQLPRFMPHISPLLQGVKELTALIFHKAQPKRMNNSIITGAMLAALTQAYVDALNEGAVPTIATAWQVLHCFTTV